MQVKLTTTEYTHGMSGIDVEILTLEGNTLFEAVTAHLQDLLVRVQERALSLGININPKSSAYNINLLGLNEDGLGWEVTPNLISFITEDYMDEYKLV